LNNDFDGFIQNNIDSHSAQENISHSSIGRYPLLLPPLPEQKAIAEVLSSLDDKIDLLHRQNKTLEEMAEALFRQWFVDDARPDWKEGKLGDYVIIKRGGSPRPIQDYLSETGYKWLKISDVTSLNSPYIFEIKECIKEEGLNKTVYLKSGALVLSNSATPGIPKILTIDTCIHDGWLYFQDAYFSNEFLYLFFKYIHPQLVSQGNGSIFINLKTDIVKCFPLYIPKKEQLDDFQKTIYPLFSKLLSNSTQIRTLEKLRDILLPKLMGGEVRVEGYTHIQ
jgi:type I restriction enzyme S subunit